MLSELWRGRDIYIYIHNKYIEFVYLELLSIEHTLADNTIGGIWGLNLCSD